MRIVSLLPSATEVVHLLGLGEALVGITHECDWPPEATKTKRVTRSLLPEDAVPAEIDRLVSASANGGPPTYELDATAIRDLDPDVILTQDLCAVCAVPAGHLRAALDLLGVEARVVSLDPSTLADVLADITTVGAVTGTEQRAEEAVSSLRRRLEEVRQAVLGLSRPRVLALEWGEPPYNPGHWVPEMIELAGGEALLASRAVPSVRIEWSEIEAAQPETVVFMPCGYDLDGAVEEAKSVIDRPELGDASFYAAASGAYFSRPGPRLVDGVEALAGALHDVAVANPPTEVMRRLR